MMKRLASKVLPRTLHVGQKADTHRWLATSRGRFSEPQNDKVRSAYGFQWSDPFRWMEAAGPAMQHHMDAEARRIHALLSSGLADRQRLILREVEELMAGNQQEEQDCTKERIGEYLYYVHTSLQHPHSHFLRQSLDGSLKQTVLDINRLTEQADGSVEIGQLKLSPSQSQVAYTASFGGESFVAVVRDIASGTETKLPGVKAPHGLEWLNEGTLLYTTSETGVRPHKVWRHVIGSGAENKLLLAEGLQECHVSLTKTKDGRFVLISSNSKTSSEVHLMDALGGDEKPRLVQARQEGLEYFVEHMRGRLVILTNADGAVDNCLVWTPVHSPEKRNWEMVIPPRPGVAVEDLDVFASHAVLWERRNGQPGFSILKWGDSGAERPPTTPSPTSDLVEEVGLPSSLRALHLRSFRFKPDSLVTKLSLGANADFQATSVDVVVSSPMLPEQPIRLDLDPDSHWEGKVRKSLHADKQEEKLAFQPPSTAALSAPTRGRAMKVWQDHVLSNGTQVPMTLVRSPHAAKPRQPCLFRIYGAYGMSLEAGYNPVDSLLLRRGWTLVFAHVRGGGELGRRWHHAGRQSGKLLALQDGHACLDHLLAHGHATRGSVALQGLSAGGVLAANLLLSRPTDFGGAVLRMPFLDLFTAMTDPRQALTQHEWDEWGHPERPGGLELLRSLCPYQGIQKVAAVGKLPPILITAGAADERVPLWMPAKWAAALRAKANLEGEDSEVYLNVIPGGHYLSQEEEHDLDALEAAFLENLA